MAGFAVLKIPKIKNEDRKSMPLKMQMPFRDISRLLFSEYSKGWYVFTVFQDRYIEGMQSHAKARRTFHENEAARRLPFERAIEKWDLDHIPGCFQEG